MKRFQARLVPGNKAPYTSWTFIIVPEAIQKAWKKPRCTVCGTINGEPFRGTVSRGEGVYRMPVKKSFLEKIGASCGTKVDVAMELDNDPPVADVPIELQAILKKDNTLAKLFDTMTPSLRRAWTSYIGEARRPETRALRAEKAPVGIRARTYPNQ